MPIVVPVLGLPSALTAWAVHTVHTLLEAQYGAVNFVPVTSKDDLATAWRQRDTRPILLHATNPTMDLCDLILASKARGIICHEPLDEVARFVAQTRHYDAVLTLRFVVQCAVALQPILQADRHGFYRLQDQDLQRQTADLVADIILHLFPDTDPSVFAAPSHTYHNPATPLQTDIEHLIPHGKRDAPSLLPWTSACLQDYAELLTPADLTQVRWPTEVFPNWDDPPQMLSAHQPLRGPARILTSGHALYLPPGLWHAAIDLTLQKTESGNCFHITLFSGEMPVATKNFATNQNGPLTVALSFEHNDSSQPLQVQIVLTEGAIDGSLWLHGVTFRRALPPHQLLGDRRDG